MILDDVARGTMLIVYVDQAKRIINALAFKDQVYNMIKNV